MHKFVLNIILRLENLRNEAPPQEKMVYSNAIMEVLELYDTACFEKAEKKDRKRAPAGMNCHGSNN